MCQISAVVEEKGDRRTVMESVTGLEVHDGGVSLATFFEEPVFVADVSIRQIDFLGGAVILEKVLPKEQGCKGDSHE